MATKSTIDFVKASLLLTKCVPTVSNVVTCKDVDNESNIKNGFYITEKAQKACLNVARYQKFIKEQFGYDMRAMNNGFYKSFHEVRDASEAKWVIDQALHYLSVFMQTDQFASEEIDHTLVYIPAQELKLPEDQPLRVVIIDAISDEDLIKHVNKMVLSGMALSGATLDAVMAIIKHFPNRFDLSAIPNKELRCRLYAETKTVPNNPTEFLRLLVYTCTNNSLLIKNKSTIELIKLKLPNKTIAGMFNKYVAANGAEKLATVFFRYKPLWLAFKRKSKKISRFMNYVRKIADEKKVPALPKALDRITSSGEVSLEEVQAELQNVTLYKKVSAVNALLYYASNPASALYIIRNGKSFTKNRDGKPFIKKQDIKKQKLDAMFGVIMDEKQQAALNAIIAPIVADVKPVVESKKVFMDEKRQAILSAIIDSIVADVKLAVEGKKIYIPEGINYAMPTSNKKMIGGIPFFSSIDMGKQMVVGIHWVNPKEHRTDLDLHYVSDKHNVGWNRSGWREDHAFFFSGDMVNAPAPLGATEAIFASSKVDNEEGLFLVNHFNSYPCDYEFFITKAEENDIDEDYLVNCHKIDTKVVIKDDGTAEDCIGMLSATEDGKKFYFCKLQGAGRRCVACHDEQSKATLSSIKVSMETRLSLKEVLSRAGAVFEKAEDEAWDVDLSLGNITEDTFVNLLTAEPEEEAPVEPTSQI